MATIDLREDYKTIRRYLKKRISDFIEDTNAGPGDTGNPISLIEFGYEYDQNGWIALIFDTRHEARPDGEWNSYIEENMLDFPQWSDAIETLWEDEKPVSIVLMDGNSLTITPDEEVVGELTDEMTEAEDLFAFLIGETLRKALIEVRDIGLLLTLPLANNCIMGVEHSNGAYGWPIYDNLLTEGKVN